MTIAILKKSQIRNDDVVLIPRREYDSLKERATTTAPFVPVVQLTGNAARKLDRRVTAALREYRQGKTKVLHSLRDLM